jgi:uncharacterized membrane protein
LQIAPGFLVERGAPPERGHGTGRALVRRMLDLLLVLLTTAFFTLSWAYVRFCAGLGGAP